MFMFMWFVIYGMSKLFLFALQIWITKMKRDESKDFKASKYIKSVQHIFAMMISLTPIVVNEDLNVMLFFRLTERK